MESRRKILSSLLGLLLVATMTLVAVTAIGAGSLRITAVPHYLSVDVASAQGTVPREIPEYQAPTLAQKTANSYQITYTDAGFVGSVRIGDEKSSEFIPQVELLRWGGEAKIVLGPPTVGGAQLSTGQASAALSSESVTWSSGDVEVLFYPLPKTESDAYGQFEYEIVLNSKPATNTISMPIELEGLVAYYQPPLTAEYKDGWSDEFRCEISVTETDVRDASTGDSLVHRPENVVGSYAVYSTTHGGMNAGEYAAAKYQAGKAFHVYRPQIFDSAGKWIWGELLIEHGTMTVVIPQSFLDTAVYPIRHAAGDTFGYTNVGGSYTGIYNYVKGQERSPSLDGDATSMHAYISCGETGWSYVEFAIYESDKDFMENTETSNMLYPWPGDWVELDLDLSQSILAANSYILCATSQKSSGTLACDSGGESFKQYCSWSNRWPDPYSTSDESYHLSIYCTYTPSGGDPDIEVAPTTEDFGTVAESGTYWANGAEPGWPLADGNCTFTITNNSGFAVDITAEADDFTGGNGWSLTSGSPGEDTVRLTAFKSGDGSGDGVALTTSGQSFITDLADSSTKKVELKLETGTYTDGSERTSTVTFTATEST